MRGSQPERDDEIARVRARRTRPRGTGRSMRGRVGQRAPVVRAALVALCALVAVLTVSGGATALERPDSLGLEQSPPTVTVVGAAQVGGDLTAEPADFAVGDVMMYAWSADGVPLTGADAARLPLTPDLVGAMLTVTATGRQDGRPDEMATATVGPVTPGVIAPVGTPLITGTPRVDAVLSGSAGTWDPAATLTYAWLADGSPVTGATSLTFTPRAEQVTAVLSLRVTAVRDGYATRSATSAVTLPVGSATFTTSPTPTISGTLRVGRVLTADPGAWSPSATLTYQWRAGGVAIAGATARTYVLQAADRTRQMSVQVRGGRPGYVPVTRTSAATAAVDYGLFTASPTPTIGGVVQIGSTVRAAPGTWSPSAVLSYQWRVGGVAITGATGASYVIPSGYLGRSLSVTVTGRRTGYLTVSRTSTARTVTQPFTAAPTPKISAQLTRVGWVQRATAGAWSPAATLSVQWRRNGAAITGATGWSYRLTTADLGKRITVTVTGRRSGYTTTTRTSAATATVLAAPYGFTSSGTPAAPPTAAYAPSVIRTLTDAQWSAITVAGVWRAGDCPGGRSTFRRVDVPYWGLDGKVHRGYVVVNADVARSTAKIFDALYAKRFPLHRVEGIENWGGWEWLASKANASTAMNCRKPSEANSSNAYSPHAWGRALDFNPVQNPYVNPHTGSWDPNPPPSASTPGTIRYGGVAWTVVTSFGWYWSGNDSWHDYMHFDTGYPSTPRSGLRVVDGAVGHDR
ncbi:hypothetical protein ASE25_13055 [Terrabacter sp. Root85]|uniref:M15 family metallopeptidase n=1 Tax=Terrabacter sp. Root85 TaxID=1736603 RepID=UPI0006F4F482|nr:M15 family metallopeptidase [Terrabacter sp. Root85]KRC88755.1 hypothetical protein ASE25_13055 [Terrabacter sp. Root85]